MRELTFMLRRSDKAGEQPVDLLDQEIGINTADRVLHYLENGEIKTHPVDDLPPFLARCLVDGFKFRGS